MTTPEIKQIQETLKVPQTGDYDQLTEAAVRNFQIKNGIDPSGIVDNVTKQKLLPDLNLGLVSTDLSENKSIKRYLLKPDEYFKGPTKKKSIFLHFTAGWDNPYNVVKDWENDKRDRIGTQFIIGGRNPQTLSDQFDGEIVECFPDYGCYGWHLGIGNTAVHRESIGIETCNFGPLTLRQGNYYSWANKRIAPSEIIDLKRDFRGYRYFHKLTDDQISSMRFLIEKIGKENDIDIRSGLQSFLKKNKDPFAVFDYNQNVRDGKIYGLFTHTNVSPKNKYGNFEKWDLFPQDSLITMLLEL